MATTVMQQTQIQYIPLLSSRDLIIPIVKDECWGFIDVLFIVYVVEVIYGQYISYCHVLNFNKQPEMSQVIKCKINNLAIGNLNLFYEVQ